MENLKDSTPIPKLEVVSRERDRLVTVSGSWNLRGLSLAPGLQRELCLQAAAPAVAWDLLAVTALDSAGAALLWKSWGESLPVGSLLRPEHAQIFERWNTGCYPTALPSQPARLWPRRLINTARDGWRQATTVVTLLGQLVLDGLYLIAHPSKIPWKEISATLHEAGGRALGITALVGFLIGIVVSYLSSLQLRTFGASIYIINILGLSVIRELGPLLAAILVAGRSGSSMTARIGVMRVTQELDALAAMGISHSMRLILPKVVALTIAMPLLVVWTDVIALIGGAISANLELDINLSQFALKLPAAVPVMNFYIGLLKGAVFGLFIAIVACHFGLRIKPDTESLGNETTNSVVASITLVILLDAVFAILFRGVGLR
jgi:phospholipid/cholesterol/gamma-HCH transport system permease protein